MAPRTRVWVYAVRCGRTHSWKRLRGHLLSSLFWTSSDSPNGPIAVKVSFMSKAR